jgi:glycosyltransferase involved in cell wall biosynthesis
MAQTVSPKISVIIPAYNESLTIGMVVSSAIASLEALGHPYEVLVIDDNSYDLTGEVAKEAGANVIKKQTCFGKGAALRTGFAAAKGDIIVTMDADGIDNPHDIGKLINPLKEADIVIGSRFLSDQGTYSMIYRISNYLFNLEIRILFGKRITDRQSGFQAIKKTALNQLDLKSNGFGIDIEIIIESLKKNFSIKEVPITVQPRSFYFSRDTGSILRENFSIMRMILNSSINRGRQ